MTDVTIFFITLLWKGIIKIIDIGIYAKKKYNYKVQNTTIVLTINEIKKDRQLCILNYASYIVESTYPLFLCTTFTTLIRKFIEFHNLLTSNS